MAFVGCIAGAIPVEDYRRGLGEAGFVPVHVTDAGADLNAYAKVEGQGGCCSPVMETSATAAPDGCCAPRDAGTASQQSLADVTVVCCGSSDAAPLPPTTGDALHARLAELLRRYDVNDYAASVRVHAVKPA